MSDREFARLVMAWSVGVLVGLFAVVVFADQVCGNIYDPMNGKWVYACVERDSAAGPPPVCRQEYDAMNGVWVTVCE